MNLPDIERPYMLLLAPGAIVWLLWSAKRSLANLTPPARRQCIVVRACILLALILALAGVRIPRPAKDGSVLFLVDASASIRPDARESASAFVRESLRLKPEADSAGVAVFAGAPTTVLPPDRAIRELAALPTPPDAGSTDIGAALQFGFGSLRYGTNRRIILLSDGHDTGGQAASAAERLRSQGVDLAVVPLDSSAPEVLVESIQVPRRPAEGEPFDLEAVIRSSVATPAIVKLFQNQFLVEQREMELKPGVNAFAARNVRAEGNLTALEIEVIPKLDTLLDNNRAQAVVLTRGQPRVLIVDPNELQIRPLAEALRRAKIQTEVRAEGGMPRMLEDLQQFDLLMVSDVPALKLTRDQLDLYRRWVQDFGGGFVMLGGDASYGVGGYFRTPVEQMLPVRMEHNDRQDLPSVALLIILDRSGSMTAQVQGVTKMSLANQGAALALDVLQPRDYFGVFAVDTRVHTVAPLAQQQSRATVEQKILTVTAGGGGIYIYTSLAEAFRQLRDVPARIKHVILFSDAADAEEKEAGEIADGAKGTGTALDLASAMLQSSITTSVVALGAEQDRDTAFLRALAERGNGRFYLTSDATSLPRIFSTETMKVAQSSLVEEPFQPVLARQHPAVAGIDWAQAPLLLGYNSVKAKPTGEVLLATERGEPLLSVWRYGLGHAAAFTSDAKPRWASEWLAWPGFGKFWAQLSRSVMRKQENSSYSVQWQERAGYLEVDIDAVTPDGTFRNGLPLSLRAVTSDGTSTEHDPVQVGPGRYHSRVPLNRQGTTMFSVSSPAISGGSYSFAHVRPMDPEWATTGINEPLLRSLAPGGYGISPADVWKPFTIPQRSLRDISDTFLMLALILLPLDIWLRRRGSATGATRRPTRDAVAAPAGTPG